MQMMTLLRKSLLGILRGLFFSLLATYTVLATEQNNAFIDHKLLIGEFSKGNFVGGDEGFV